MTIASPSIAAVLGAAVWADHNLHDIVAVTGESRVDGRDQGVGDLHAKLVKGVYEHLAATGTWNAHGGQAL
eukprot:24898-Eustigmatos_ZCMA.PRE.1